jgi:hypothetical protein
MKFKIWFLEQCVKFCNKGLQYSEGAEDQNDINEVVSSKNYFLRELRKLKDKQRLRSPQP